MTHTENKTQDLTVYLLVRTDLPSLNSGKAMSQCHHAGVQMMGRYASHPLVNEYINAGMTSGASWFNTTLVLRVGDGIIGDIVMKLTGLPNVLCGSVVDPSYPFAADSEMATLLERDPRITRVKTLDNGMVLLTREELTCAWFLGDRNDPNFCNLFSGFPLHP